MGQSEAYYFLFCGPIPPIVSSLFAADEGTLVSTAIDIGRLVCQLCGTKLSRGRRSGPGESVVLLSLVRGFQSLNDTKQDM